MWTFPIMVSLRSILQKTHSSGSHSRKSPTYYSYKEFLCGLTLAPGPYWGSENPFFCTSNQWEQVASHNGGHWGHCVNTTTSCVQRTSIVQIGVGICLRREPNIPSKTYFVVWGWVQVHTGVLVAELPFPLEQHLEVGRQHPELGILCPWGSSVLFAEDSLKKKQRINYHQL